MLMSELNENLLIGFYFKVHKNKPPKYLFHIMIFSLLAFERL